MGNAVVSNLGEGLATAAVAKYLRLTKDQVRLLQTSLGELAGDQGRGGRGRRDGHRSKRRNSGRRSVTIGRPLFQIAVLSRAKIRPALEARLLDLLFTAWDENGDDRIRYADLIVAIAPLACPGESLSHVLHFCLQVMDFGEEDGDDDDDEDDEDDDFDDDDESNPDGHDDDVGGKLRRHTRALSAVAASRNGHNHQPGVTTSVVTAAQLLRVLQNVNKLAALFGDCVLTDRQIHKVVDGIFDTITLISDDDETDILTHDECIDRLLQEPLVQRMAFNKLKEYNDSRAKDVDGDNAPKPATTVATTFITRHSTLVMPAPRPGMVLSPRSIGAPTHATVAAPSPRSYYTHPSVPGSPFYGTRSTVSTPRSYGTGYTSGPSGTYNSAGDTYTYTSAGVTYYTNTTAGSGTQTTQATPLYSLPAAAAHSPRTPPAPRFFRYDNPSPRKTYIDEEEPFAGATRLEEESLLTDVSSHFLTPLAYVPVHNALSDELVSL